MIQRIVPLVLIVAAGTAIAGGSWTDSVSYRPNANTSLKIVEPKGFAITVDTPDGPKSGTVPEVFTLPNNDAFVKVTLTARDGTPWSKKIEIRTRQQATLEVGFAATADAPRSKARTFVAKASNLSQGCGNANKGKMKIDFLDGEGQVAKSVSVDATYSQQFDIPAGSLDARVYLKGEYVLTKAVKAARDGLSLEFGCDESRRRFFLVVR